MEMVARNGKDVKPLFLKLGLALVLSLSGYVIAHLRSRPRPPPSPPPSVIEPEAGGKPNSSVSLKDELCILRREEGLSKIINGASTTTTTTATTTTKAVVELSPTSRSTGDDEGFLLPEFNELMLKEFEISGKDPESSPTPTPRRLDTREDSSSMGQEISHLKSLVFSLRERERNLEVQLLEYYGMQEREAAVRELESQLKINTMESQLFSLKIESLQSENQRLQAQVLGHSRLMNELEGAKFKIKALKRKLKSDGEQAREKISALHQRIGVLQDREQKDGRDALEVERRLKELEEEIVNLGRRNSSLDQENLELKRKLESTQKITASVIEGLKTEELEEMQHLKQSNDRMLKDIEQLRIDHCSDVEELVYLRWVNACLRYELRIYQPPQGKTVARDLSKCLSPRSEEKAKKLILEYANSRVDEKGMSPGDLDDYSSSHTSTGESDDTFIEVSSNLKHNSNKSKFFSKLKKVVLGKDNHSNRVSSVDRTPPSCGNSDRRVSFSNSSLDDTFGRDSYDSFSSSMAEEMANQTPGTELQVDEQRSSKHSKSQRSSVNFQRLRRINVGGRVGKGEKTDVESPCSHNKRNSEEEIPMDSTHSRGACIEENDMPEKVELRKYAEVLKGSPGSKKVIRKSTSFSQ